VCLAFLSSSSSHLLPSLPAAIIITTTTTHPHASLLLTKSERKRARGGGRGGGGYGMLNNGRGVNKMCGIPGEDGEVCKVRIECFHVCTHILPPSSFSDLLSLFVSYLH
jgi:hypothetical protein